LQRSPYNPDRAAAVIVSVVYVAKGCINPPYGESFIGSYVLGVGFTFNNTGKSGVSNVI
jgi:hypothetical protein